MILTAAILDDFEDPTLRDRARVHAASDVVFLRAAADDECGLVVLDLTSGDDDEALLVEIFVAPTRRFLGLGTSILSAAEAFAFEAGKKRISLEAEPLDDEDDDSAKERLINWYKQRGYAEAGPWDVLGKRLDR